MKARLAKFRTQPAREALQFIGFALLVLAALSVGAGLALLVASLVLLFYANI